MNIWNLFERSDRLIDKIFVFFLYVYLILLVLILIVGIIIFYGSIFNFSH